jgi:hypothetical protein
MKLNEFHQMCPECGGPAFSSMILAEKKDACYYKVKASAKVWPSAYASGRLVQCRKKGAANYGNKSESVTEEPDNKCPPATQDITLNLKNRQKAIDEYGYGPLNPDMPNNKFWMAKQDEWNLDSVEEAQQSLCGNCAAFDVRQATLDCIAQGIDADNPEDAEGVIDAGDLGYCKFLKFKCASRRTCDAWVTGGPLTDKPGVAEGSWQTPGLNLEPMGSKKERDIQRQQGLRPTGPQRLMSELADMLHISVGQLTWLAQKIPGFPLAHGRHTSSQGNKGYYDLAAFKHWVVANKVREKIADSSKQGVAEEWSQKYKSSINCSHPKGFSQKAHCAGKKKHNESIEMEMVCEDCGMCETHVDHQNLDEACWKSYHKEGNKELFGKTVPNCVKNTNEEASMADELDRILELGGVKLNEELVQEFDLIESIIEDLADRNGVDADVIWEDLDSLSDDELYVFAVTQEPITEDWQKANKKDRTAGMSQKAVNAYRRENPGSKLKTAVTTKPSKLKRGSKASKRRKSYCSRSRGQMKMHNISCAKTPDKAICKARRRWNC